MAQINQNIASHLSFVDNSGKTYVTLDANKPITSYHISYPISWIGFVCGYEVEIIQLTDNSFSIEDYEFKKYPLKFNYLKEIIINLIDDFLHKNLD